ncbi:MAG: flagellar biosynthesis regulator FlaF [Hyphomicrobiales bacterium]
MQNAAQAYSSTARTTIQPREREASLLIKSAAQLQQIKEHWQDDRENLNDALQYNRKLWSVFVSSVAEPSNPLPVAIKNNIASLGVFIFRHTVSVQARPSPDKLGVLIAINRDIAAGLRGQ